MSFEFTAKTKEIARGRQDSLCAIDGESLNDREEHAHHVAPKQSGDPHNPDHSWIKESDNCVIVCVQCHERAHQDAKFKKGAFAPPSVFEYSHASDAAAHKSWATNMDKKIEDLFKK